jgi:hypothetical protein
MPDNTKNWRFWGTISFEIPYDVGGFGRGTAKKAYVPATADIYTWIGDTKVDGKKAPYCGVVLHYTPRQGGYTCPSYIASALRDVSAFCRGKLVSVALEYTDVGAPFFKAGRDSDEHGERLLFY